MKINLKTSASFFAVSALSLFACASAQAQSVLIYQQTFTLAPSTNATLATVTSNEWHDYVASNNTDVSATFAGVSASGVTAPVSPLTPATGSPNIGGAQPTSVPAGGASVGGYIFTNGNDAAGLYVTTSKTVDPTLNPAFGWVEQDPNTSGSWSLVLEQNNNWYISTTATSVSTGGGGNTGLQTNTPISQAFTTTGWDNLVIGGTGLGTTGTITIGTVTTLSATSAIQGFGLYYTGGTGNGRVDNFTVTVPEPSTWALLVAGVMTLLGVHFRRQRQ